MQTPSGSHNETPVVLLHSLGTDSRMWRHQSQALSRLGHVVTPEARGHGTSPWPGSVDLESWVHDLHAVIRPLGPVHLVGLSMGGMQAVAYAATHPTLVTSLVIANSFARLSESVAEARFEAAVQAIGDNGIGGYAEIYLEQTLTTALATVDYEVLRASIANMRHEAYLASAEATFHGDVTPHLSQVRCPTLVLTGENDRKTPLSSAEQFVDCIAGAQVDVIPGAGHLSAIENPEGFNTTVATFLSKVSAGVEPLRVRGGAQ